MKAFTVTTVVVGALFVSLSNAQCICDPNDTHCLSRCVADTNDCVSECKSNTECYSRCIEYHWPTGSETYESLLPSSTLSGVFASSTPATLSASTTTSAWYGSSSSPTWSQSASWVSMTTWAPSQSSIVASTTPSTSGSSSLNSPHALFGMVLAAAAAAAIYVC